MFEKGSDKMEECKHKKTLRGEDEKKLIINRLSRIEGQLAGIKRMVEKDTYCNDILVQLSAAQNSLKSLSNHMLEQHLYTCVSEDIRAGKDEVIDELVTTLQKLMK